MEIMMDKSSGEKLTKQQSVDEDEPLQDMVREMKTGFSTALEALAQIQFVDQVLQERVSTNKVQHDSQLADVLHMVLTLKTEFGTVMGQLHTATDNQTRLQRQIEVLQYERDILLEELHRQGAVSEEIRHKYHSGRVRPNGLNRSSDQTTLSAMLERAHNVFNTPQQQQHNVSDHDSGVNTYRDNPDVCSLGDVSPPGVNPLVHSYIASLQESLHQSLHDSLHHHSLHDELADENYDSQSSITAAANKSLDLSRSLGDKCAEVANVDSSEEEDEVREEEEEEEIVVEHDKRNVEIVDMTENSINHSNNQQSNVERPASSEKLIKPDDNSPVFAQPMTPKRIAPHERNTKEVQRMRIAREIVETERKYCSNLWTVIDLYLGPLQSTGILQPKEASVMFPASLGAIYDYHCGFLQKLEERVTNWKWHSVLGDILCRFIESAECDLLHQYQVYVNEFPASLCQIRKSCKNSARFRKFLRMMQRHPSCEGLDIGCFMVTPIQRIPRYVLLLKQLLKHTDREHPDYYYVETALEHLGDFLNKLNDSIEYSMQIMGTATTEGTPKLRRKLRIGSFRSSSINSYDANSSRMNDTSLQGGDDHSMLSTSTSASHSRFFNFSFLRDSFRRKQQTSTATVNHSCNTPQHNYQASSQPDRPRRDLPPMPASSRMLNQSLSMSSVPQPSEVQNTPRHSSVVQPMAREQSFSGDAGTREQSFSTLPSRSDKRRRAKRRPKSGYVTSPAEQSYAVPQIRTNGSNGQGHQDGAMSQHKITCKQRPRSMMDSMSEASQRSSVHTSQSHWPNTTSQESLNTVTGDNQTLSSANSTRQRPKRIGSSERLQILPDMPKAMPGPSTTKTKSLPDVSHHKVHQRMPRSNSRKLPIPPTTRPARNDYGIYGDNDDLSDDGCFKPPLVQKVVSGRNEHLGVPRSSSHGDILDGSHSPSQDYINVALARSLTENCLDDSLHTPLPRTSTSLIEQYHALPSTLQPQATTLQPHPNHKQRPRSAKPRHVTLPREGSKPEILKPKENISIQESPETPTKQHLNNATIEDSPQRKDMPFKRKKERSSKKSLNMTSDIGEGEKNDKKKASLKQSIKSLFFRKRKHDRSVMLGSSPPHKQNVNTIIHDNDVNTGSENSRAIELIPYDEYPENGHQVYTSTTSPSPSVSTLQLHTGPREQAPPHERVIVLDPVEPQLETYADENGEPCSAV